MPYARAIAAKIAIFGSGVRSAQTYIYTNIHTHMFSEWTATASLCVVVVGLCAYNVLRYRSCLVSYAGRAPRDPRLSTCFEFGPEPGHLDLSKMTVRCAPRDPRPGSLFSTSRSSIFQGCP